MQKRFATIALLICGSIALISQETGRRATPLIHQAVNENKLITLAGNTRPEARAENDLGPVSDATTMDHMMLQLKRSDAQEQAAAKFVDDLHNPASPNFHKWITPADYGKNYGAAESDIQTVTGWLQSHGFTVNGVYPSGMVIDFSGTAGAVRRAFHTPIHNLMVDGVNHIANMNDPQIPEALAPAVAGVVSLHDFMPHKMSRPKYTFTDQGFTYEALVPADLATIYDLNPLFAAGVTGTGQTIAVFEDTNLYSNADYSTFRSTFGLSQYTGGTLTTVHPAGSGVTNCTNPGVNSDDAEAIIDAEWAGAAAPNAAIVVASCADSRTTFGGFIAMQNMVNAANPPQVMSVSYGECEAENGASSNTAINALYQQAVMEGISVFVAAGDEGAASCDAGASTATHGIGVSAYASTSNNVAVGGTDFGDSYAGTNSQYWNSSNGSNYASALSYVPEIPWNDSCASGLLANYFGYSTVYGTGGFCNSNTAISDQFQEVVAGSGGPSNCATGAPSTTGVASGSCQGFAKPSWQAGIAGLPSDGVRDLPDVSLFAGDGLLGHFYVTCFSDRRNGGAACTGNPSGWAGAGGTSFAAPIFAGLQALVNQKMGGPQGNPNYVLYKLASAVPSVFHSVLTGDIDVNCTGTSDCYGSSGSNGGGGRGGRGGGGFGTTVSGALSVSTSSFEPAYGTGTVWNFATGMGSVDAYQLVMNWSVGQ